MKIRLVIRFFDKIIKFLDIDRSHLNYKFENYDALLDDFAQNKIDILVCFSLPLQDLEVQPGVNKMYLTTSEADVFQKRIHNVAKTNLKEDKTFNSLGSWSFLVGLNNSLERIKPQDKLIPALIEAPKDSIGKYFSRLINNSIESYKENKHH